MNPCGKYWHISQAEAQQKVVQMQRNPAVRAPQLLNAYFCDRCEGWHVGHNWQWMNHKQ